jgi:hypothetical protein
MRLKYNVLSIFILFYVTSVFAQSNSNWSPIGLSVSGKNMQNGVEAFYQLSKCNNEDVVFIKFINNNANAVVVEWNDAIFTKALQLQNNQKGNNKKTLTIGANKVIFGDCSSKSQPELTVKVHDFINNIADFKLFKVTSFQVTLNQ